MAKESASSSFSLLNLLSKIETNDNMEIKSNEKEAKKVDLELSLSLGAPCTRTSSPTRREPFLFMGPKVDEAVLNAQVVQPMQKYEAINMMAKRKRDVDDHTHVSRVFSTFPPSAPPVAVTGVPCHWMAPYARTMGSMANNASTYGILNGAPVNMANNVTRGYYGAPAMASSSTAKGNTTMVYPYIQDADKTIYFDKSLPKLRAYDPNGNETKGMLYKLSKGVLTIVCICHGSFFTPEEFVKHAGGGDVDIEHALKHISVPKSRRSSK